MIKKPDINKISGISICLSIFGVNKDTRGMRLTSIRLSNYKGFKDTAPIALGKHWTVVVGRNNAGKSALLEAFSVGTFINKPHRSIKQSMAFPLSPSSRVDVDLEISIRELEEAFLGRGQTEIWVPVPDNDSEEFLRRVFLVTDLQLSIYKTGNQDWQSNRRPSHGHFVSHHISQPALRLIARADRQAWEVQDAGRSSNDDIPSLAGYAMASGSYVFRAERRVNGVSNLQVTTTLEPDASNLPGALHFLFNNNHEQFRRYLALVKEVLPEIEAITIPPLENNRVEIRVWNNGYYQERPDLAIPLQECGTGIGQVLAILFVAVTASAGRILVIDEPNSFLHPGASRVLMQLLRKFEHHQYIITTHSPEIIAATEPDKIVVVRWEDDESRVAVYGGAAALGVRSAFDELGVRLSDVYGYDSIAWVEGKTEERCFPALLQAVGASLPSRTAFVAVVNTGDFDHANAAVIWGVYRQLATQSAFAPRAISISLDSELRSSKLKNELVTKSGGLVRFLPRRTYENYLLHPAAIAAVITTEASGESFVSAEDVSNWLERHRHNPIYFARGASPTIDVSGAWRITIDAPRLLGDLIGEITHYKQDYRSRKVQYGVAITSWLIKNDKAFLEEITDYVRGLLAPMTAAA